MGDLTVHRERASQFIQQAKV